MEEIRGVMNLNIRVAVDMNNQRYTKEGVVVMVTIAHRHKIEGLKVTGTVTRDMISITMRNLTLLTVKDKTIVILTVKDITHKSAFVAVSDKGTGDGLDLHDGIPNSTGGVPNLNLGRIAKRMSLSRRENKNHLHIEGRL